MIATPLARAWTPAIACAFPPAAPAARVAAGPLAFVLHAAELLNHYQPIWDHLDPAGFEIIVAGELEADNARVARHASAHGYAASWVGDVLAAGRQFEAVVSNHPGAGGALGGGQGAVVPHLGRRQVRMMYALGKDAWNYAPWNEQYDLVLAWGPYHASRLAAFERPRIVQVGHPRLDRLAAIREPRRDAVARLGGDPDRPTLLWLPTWSGASSIDAFADTIAGLRTRLNVLLKVHPFTATREPERMARLAALGLASTADPFADNVELIHAADIVAADFGGSAFAALYADRDLVLLNTPGVGTDPSDGIVGAESLELTLRGWILNIDPGEGALILDHLADPAARGQQAGVRERLRRELFAPFRGCAGEVAASVLRHLDTVLA
jgi:hypothetical protein